MPTPAHAPPDGAAVPGQKDSTASTKSPVAKPQGDHTFNHSTEAQAPVDGDSNRSADRSVSHSSPLDDHKLQPRDIILQSLSPRIAVYASKDTDELIRLKGIYGGFCGLLRPFGEDVQRVVIRDNANTSRSWEHFGVHFVDFGQIVRSSPVKSNVDQEISLSRFDKNAQEDASQSAARQVATQSLLDRVVRYHMHQADSDKDVSSPTQTLYPDEEPSERVAPHFRPFLTKLLAGRNVTPYEMFTHPVACVVAISSQNSSPIESLRDLYNETCQDLPEWIDGEFLRYYVLVHDEDHDDLARSTHLFNQMKRHFGLHCHLLRIRSEQCSSTDQDASTLPACQWLDLEEEVTAITQKEDALGTNDFRQYLFTSDSTVIKTFVREMVTQSVIPFMENRVRHWNDQVSRRRGLSGRFMSLSKKWAGFGTSRTAKATTGGQNNHSNFDAEIGSYAADTPESMMHRLADYALMLRDWKTAAQTYEILTSDFSDDKAWYHHATANEMMIISNLLARDALSIRTPLETIDQMVDTSTYSYLTRCSDPEAAMRCIVVAVELLLTSGAPSTRAATWAERLLELSILSPLAQSIWVERLVECYITQLNTKAVKTNIGHRKVAFWSFLSSQLWLAMEEPTLAAARLKKSASFYREATQNNGLAGFSGAQVYWEKSMSEVAELLSRLSTSEAGDARMHLPDSIAGNDEDEERGAFSTNNVSGHRHRPSTGKLTSPTSIGLLERLQVSQGSGDDGFV